MQVYARPESDIKRASSGLAVLLVPVRGILERHAGLVVGAGLSLGVLAFQKAREKGVTGCSRLSSWDAVLCFVSLFIFESP